MTYNQKLAGSICRVSPKGPGIKAIRSKKFFASGSAPHPDVRVAFEMCELVTFARTEASFGKGTLTTDVRGLVTLGTIGIAARCLARSPERAVVQFNQSVIEECMRGGLRLIQIDGKTVALLDKSKKTNLIRRKVIKVIGESIPHSREVRLSDIPVVFPLQRIRTLMPAARKRMTPRERDLINVTRRKPSRESFAGKRFGNFIAFIS